MPKQLFQGLVRSKEKGALGRYPKKTRMTLYKQAIGILGREKPIGLCEETRDIWLALGLDAESKSSNCGG